MNNRSSLRESLRNNIPSLQHHRRGGLNNNSSTSNSNSLTSSSDDHNTLDLFSKSRTSIPDHHTSDSDVLVKLGRLSLGSNNKHKIDDSAGKHDYDWLLTPPGTPLVADDGNHAPRRSLSTTKPSSTSSSRLSVSTKRPSLSTSQQYSNNKSTNILNTSSASVSSYITRPSTPTRRSSTPSSVSRSATPSRPRPSSSSSSTDKPRPSLNSRPSTPTSRSQYVNSPASRPSTPTSRSQYVNSPANATSSRPSTPTRRTTAPSSSPSTPAARILPNARNSVSRPSSPSPRVRSTGQPIVLPHFPLDTPPNLRTTLPDRPISVGRSRPAAKGNVEPMMVTNNSSASVSARGRQSSPAVSRGRLSESAGRAHRTLAPANENLGDAALDSRRELLSRKPAKTSADTTGFGRTISKKSLDMAIKHMDIRNGSNGHRPITGSNLFPQSIRSSNQRSQTCAVSINRNHLSIGAAAENRNHINECFYESGSEENRNQSSAKLSNIDIYESSRYDMILLKEDLTNTNWLHSLDDKTDQGPIFDNGFELLPEPFDPL